MFKPKLTPAGLSLGSSGCYRSPTANGQRRFSCISRGCGFGGARPPDPLLAVTLQPQLHSTESPRRARSHTGHGHTRVPRAGAAPKAGSEARMQLYESLANALWG